MPYKYLFHAALEKEMAVIGKKDRDLIEKRVDVLLDADDPRKLAKKLQNSPLWSFRAGNYRVLLGIDTSAKIIRIVHIGIRGKVYRHKNLSKVASRIPPL